MTHKQRRTKRQFRTYRFPEQHCLSCKSPVSANGSLNGGRQPRKDDITVCLACGHLMSFDANMRLVELSDTQIIEVAADRDVLEIQKIRALTAPKRARASP